MSRGVLPVLLVAGVVLLAPVAPLAPLGGVAAAESADAGPVAGPTVAARLDGTTARLTARYVVRVDEQQVADGLVSLRLPRGAVVTAATAILAGKAHRFTLEPVADVERAFAAVVEAAGDRDRGWALKLVQVSPDQLSLAIASPRRARLELRLELEAPTCFLDDVRYLAVPGAWAGAVPRGLTRRAPAIDPCRAASRAAHASDCEGDVVWLGWPRPLTVRAPGPPRIGTRAERLDVGTHHLARVELALAAQLGDIPGDLHTAIVIDGSRSLDADERETQRALIASYLRHAPRGQVQLVSYARDATALLPRWQGAAQAAPGIARALANLMPRNGSNLDAGLAEAARWLARARGTRRVIVFTDERLAQRLLDQPPAALAQLVPAATLIHVVALDRGTGGLVRDDAARLAPLAAATAGIAVRRVTKMAAPPDALMLARPLALDHVRLVAPGWTPLTSIEALGGRCPTEPPSLGQGRACSWWGQGTATAGPITLEGSLWGTRVTRIVRPDPAHALALARMLTVLGPLDPPVQRVVDQLARAINPVWSLYAAWGGRDGYVDSGQGGVGGYGVICGGCTAGPPPYGIAIGGIGTLSNMNSLQAQLAAAIAPCQLGAARVSLTVETTLHEIVDVSAALTLPAGTVPAVTHALHACVVERVWQAELGLASPAPHATTTFAFAP